MRNILLLLLSCLIGSLSNLLNAQTLTQDAEGKSSVVYQGGNIGIDIAKTNITFAYTNLGLSPKKNESQVPNLIWGVNAYGKNNEGLGQVFKRGDFQPESGFGGFIGVKYRFDSKPGIIITLDKEQDTLVNEKIMVNNLIDSLTGKEGDDNKRQLETLKNRQKELDIAIQAINDRREKINDQRVRKLGLLYVRGGRSATAFKLIEENQDTSELSKSFINKDVFGGYLGFGVNYETGRWLFGVSIDYEFTNNFDDLSKKSYTLSTEEVKGNETLESKKEITAFSGNYATYERVNFNFDAIAFSKLDDDDRNFIAWNFYVRHKISQSKEIVPTYTNMGLGAYFFNKSNKFLGGFYIEAPDIFQDREIVKEDPEIREIQNRLSFGLVARFNFASIIGPSY